MLLEKVAGGDEKKKATFFGEVVRIITIAMNGSGFSPPFLLKIYLYAPPA